MIIDTHCHLSISLDNEKINKGCIMITSGYSNESNKEVIELINKSENIYGTIGLHPEELDNIKESDFVYLEQHILDKKIVAIGEIGLDYYYRKDNIKKQKEVFIRQLDLAQKYNKPVVIHSRDAINDVYNILSKYNLKGDIHCFSSSKEMANKFIKLGYYIGIGGVVTFKNSRTLKEVVENIPLSNILLETDSPYLSPEPLRGKKNIPKNVVLVANKVSELKQIKIEEVIKTTNNNAKNLFDLNK